jgi:hypothetical protein
MRKAVEEPSMVANKKDTNAAVNKAGLISLQKKKIPSLLVY